MSETNVWKSKRNGPRGKPVLELSTDYSMDTKTSVKHLFYYIRSNRPLGMIKEIIEEAYESYKKLYPDYAAKLLPFELIKAQPTGVGQNNYSSVTAFDPDIYNFLIEDEKISQLTDFKISPYNLANPKLYPDTAKHTHNLYIILPSSLRTSVCYAYIEGRLEMLKTYGVLHKRKDVYHIAIPKQDRVKDTHDGKCFVSWKDVSIEDAVQCNLFIDGTQWPGTETKVIVKWCFKNQQKKEGDLFVKGMMSEETGVVEQKEDDGFKLVDEKKAAKTIKLNNIIIDVMNFPTLEETQ